jgi:hypothetical protein
MFREINQVVLCWSIPTDRHGEEGGRLQKYADWTRWFNLWESVEHDAGAKPQEMSAKICILSSLTSTKPNAHNTAMLASSPFDNRTAYVR